MHTCPSAHVGPSTELQSSTRPSRMNSVSLSTSETIEVRSTTGVVPKKPITSSEICGLPPVCEYRPNDPGSS